MVLGDDKDNDDLGSDDGDDDDDDDAGIQRMYQVTVELIN